MMDAELDLLREFLRAHPRQAADALEAVEVDETAAILADVDPEFSTAVLRHFAPTTGGDVLARMEPTAAMAIACRLPTDMAAALLRRAGIRASQLIFDVMPEPWRGRLTPLLDADPDTAQGWMNPMADALPEDLSVDAAMQRLRNRAQSLSFDLFVVDRDHRLVGRTDLRQLMLAEPSEPIDALMQRRAHPVLEDQHMGALLDMHEWEDFDTLPVVDAQGIFLGALPHAALRRWQGQDVGADREHTTVGTALALSDLFWSGMSEALAMTSELAVQALAPKPEAAEEYGGS